MQHIQKSRSVPGSDYCIAIPVSARSRGGVVVHEGLVEGGVERCRGRNKAGLAVPELVAARPHIL
eukprot:1161123-Pelagomonas_calceolata.AAC.2